MAVVTSDFLAGVLSNFRALFNRDFAAATGLQEWRDLTATITSTGEDNQYTWFGTVPQMADVTHGGVVKHGLPRFNFTITNLEYQAAIEVERAALERDRLNLITPRIGQMAQEAARHPGQLIYNLFETPGNAFDGVAFFANTRTIGDSANIDNILAGTGTTIAQIQADLAAARSAMRLFQDDKGRPMNLIGNTIVCHPDLEQTMFQALNANQGTINQPVLPAGEPATRQRGYVVIANPYLTDVNDWYLLHIGGPDRRPFIYQTEKRPELTSDTDPNSRAVIEERTFLYSVYGRYAVGVTDPRFAIRTTNV